MPNLSPPITNAAQAAEYRQRILAAVGEGSDFMPVMSIYLTDRTDPADISAGFSRGHIQACKLYPAHATTNSAMGVTDIRLIYPVLEVMQRDKIILQVHGEATDHDVDIFDREAVFIDRTLTALRHDFPDLKIVFEHITTEHAVEFVKAEGSNLAATITPHHLHINRNAMFDGGLRPHFYCLPVAKREHHRIALRKAATSGHHSFFLGTDSAPHDVSAKEAACGCAGIFNAPYALESYATVFEEEHALDRLEGFASIHGAQFYGLPVNSRRVLLEKQPLDVTECIDAGGYRLVPFHAGEQLRWRFIGLLE